MSVYLFIVYSLYKPLIYKDKYKSTTIGCKAVEGTNIMAGQ